MKMRPLRDGRRREDGLAQRVGAPDLVHRPRLDHERVSVLAHEHDAAVDHDRRSHERGRDGRSAACTFTAPVLASSAVTSPRVRSPGRRGRGRGWATGRTPVPFSYRHSTRGVPVTSPLPPGWIPIADLGGVASRSRPPRRGPRPATGTALLSRPWRAMQLLPGLGLVRDDGLGACGDELVAASRLHEHRGGPARLDLARHAPDLAPRLAVECGDERLLAVVLVRIAG